jgi:hypothetical protein
MQTHRTCAKLSFRNAVAAGGLGLLLCSPLLASEETVGDAPAIPPGQENLLLEMLGPGAPLPGCELVDGQVNFTVVNLTYECAGGEIEYELAHRSQGTRESTPTDKFAITLISGTPPRGFADALVSMVRAREREFEWIWPGEDDPE